MNSFINIPIGSDFSIHNIPFGMAKKGNYTFACTRIGDTIIDLNACHKAGLFSDLTIPIDVFTHEVLNKFIALGKPITSEVRLRLRDGFCTGGFMESAIEHNDQILVALTDVSMLMPIHIGDYTDFYSSKEHATNVGTMFRDPDNALLPNWLHLPVGYHGRASSISVSGTPIHRPKGQTIAMGADQPTFGATKQLDFELEMGFVIGKDTLQGQSISTGEAEEYIFGVVLFNDWSARDIQKWEYVPLGPFLAKNFASTISPWIVTLDALEPFRCSGPSQNPEVLSYLRYDGGKNYDINLSVDIHTSSGVRQRVSTTNFKFMYWNMCQQLAHHTVNGCNVRVGDLMASGTISGPTPESYGSMLEICWKGTKPITLPDGSQRVFIEDGDTVSIRGWSER
ncbi:MAG: fumarylacetoacetase, partial [Saprospiraceae bacterium]